MRVVLLLAGFVSVTAQLRAEGEPDYRESFRLCWPAGAYQTPPRPTIPVPMGQRWSQPIDALIAQQDHGHGLKPVDTADPWK